MAWQSSTINPTVTTPADDISKIKNDLGVIRSVLGGATDTDVPVTIGGTGLTPWDVTISGDYYLVTPRSGKSVSGSANFSAALGAAIDSVLTAGGGVITIPPGTWTAASTITRTLTAPVTIVLAPGAVISKTTDGDLFAFTLSGSGSITLTGTGTLAASWSGASTTAAALRVVGTTSSRTVTVGGGVQIMIGAGVWKYGLHCTDVQDPLIDGVLMAGGGETSGSMEGIYITCVNGPSVSWTIRGLDLYNVLYAVHVGFTRSPGVEGLKLVDCDFVGVKHGLWFDNQGTYSPPQIELNSCHINSYNSCVKITRAIQVSVIGGLYYRYSRTGGTFSEGAFFELDGVQGFVAEGPHLSVTTAGVDIYGFSISSVSQASAFLRFLGVHFWATARSAPVIKITGNAYAITLAGDCVKDTNGQWIDTSAMTSAGTEICVDRSLRIVASDYPSMVMTDCAYSAGAINVAGALWGMVNITGAVSGNTITSITGTVPGRTYVLKCDTAGVILQHNASCNLRGGVNITFAAGDTVTLYAETSTLREHARRAA